MASRINLLLLVGGAGLDFPFADGVVPWGGSSD